MYPTIEDLRKSFTYMEYSKLATRISFSPINFILQLEMSDATISMNESSFLE